MFHFLYVIDIDYKLIVPKKYVICFTFKIVVSLSIEDKSHFELVKELPCQKRSTNYLLELCIFSPLSLALF